MPSSVQTHTETQSNGGVKNDLQAMGLVTVGMKVCSQVTGQVREEKVGEERSEVQLW